MKTVIFAVLLLFQDLASQADRTHFQVQFTQVVSYDPGS